MRLQNVHKKCKIYIEERGKLDLGDNNFTHKSRYLL